MCSDVIGSLMAVVLLISTPLIDGAVGMRMTHFQVLLHVSSASMSSLGVTWSHSCRCVSASSSIWAVLALSLYLAIISPSGARTDNQSGGETVFLTGTLPQHRESR